MTETTSEPFTGQAPARDAEAVVLERVHKSFGTRRAVDDMSFRVPAGTVYGIIGPNGSGKSTTLRMITRIHHPDGGRIRVLGQDASLGDGASDRIGYLPEERGLYRKMPVGELLRFFAALKGVSDGRARVESRLWLERLGIGDCEKRRVEALSKGMAQKVQFIAAVLHRPELLILDEPFSGLDPVNLEAIGGHPRAPPAGDHHPVFDPRHGGGRADVRLHPHDPPGRKVLDGTLDSIQQRTPSTWSRCASPATRSRSTGCPGVARVNDHGRLQELRLEPGCDPQSILRALAERVRVEHFEVARPHLHDIFVRIAGPQAAEEAGDGAEIVSAPLARRLGRCVVPG